MQVKFLPIKKQLIFIVFLSSTLVSAVLVVAKFLLEYQGEISHIKSTIEHVKLTMVKPLSQAVWDFHDQQIRFQIESLEARSEFANVVLVSFADNKVYSADSDATQSDVADSVQVIKVDNAIDFSPSNDLSSYEAISLSYLSQGSEHFIGRLYLEPDRDGAFHKVFNNLLYFFFLQFVKTFFLSYFFVWAFGKIITDPIMYLKEYLNTQSNNGFIKFMPFKLRKNARFSLSNLLYKMFGGYWDDDFNELSRVVSSTVFKAYQYNKLQSSLLKQAEKDVENEKERSLNSAKMASLGEMAAGISHEINNPLAIILGKAKSIKRQLQHDKDQVNFDELMQDLDKINQVGQRIVTIIKSLKSYARDGSADRPVSTNFIHVLNEAVELTNLKLQEGKVRLFFCYNPLWVLVRPGEIVQVLTNLISNSVDALDSESIEKEKWIRIEIERKKDFVEVRMIDSGKGIPKEIADRVMNPFFTTKDPGKGTGLGLSISKKIIDGTGGKFYLDQGCKNTCFVVELPLAEA